MNEDGNKRISRRFTLAPLAIELAMSQSLRALDITAAGGRTRSYCDPEGSAATGRVSVD